jgi:hypothetical protein
MKKKKEKISKKLKEKFLELILDSKCHGLPNIFSNRICLTRILWIILVSLSITINLYQIYLSLIDYFNFDYVTNIDSVYEEHVIFPTISMCSNGKIFSRQLNAIISNCNMNNNDCTKNPDLYFEKYIDNYYGTCVRFNKNGSFYSTLAGIDGGLQIDLLGEHSGFILYIHNQTKLPLQNFEHNNHNRQAVYVSSGFDTNLVVERIIYNRLDQPYNDCYKNVSKFRFNKTLIDYIALQLNQTYSQDLCYVLCFDLAYINNSTCECKNKQLGQVWSNCYRNVSDCTFKFKATFYETNIADKCEQYCPLECDTVSYEVNSYSKLFGYPLQYNSTRIKVNYKDLKYTLISQQPKMLLTDLIATIGGLFGVFLGCSFLTFIEIFEHIIELSYIMIRNIKNNKV